MVVVVFRSRARAESLTDLIESGRHLFELASRMPGFISYKEFAAEDGEFLSLVEFATPEHLKAWREHPEHAMTQRRQAAFFSEYRVQVCALEREVGFPLRSAS